jgi:hypothetical protein
MGIVLPPGKSIPPEGTGGRCGVREVQFIENAGGIAQKPNPEPAVSCFKKSPVLLEKVHDFEPIIAALNGDGFGVHEGEESDR